MMKVVIVGKGLAGIGALAALREYKNSLPDLKITWIGPSLNQRDWFHCSLNSTAVVALQGIKKGVSPLGDDLYDAYSSCIDFLERNKPSGVEKATRFHLGEGESLEKLKLRFTKTEDISLGEYSGRGVREDAFLFEPMNFLSWWKEDISREFDFVNLDDVVLSIDSEAKILKTQSKSISFDVVLLCTGSLGTDFQLAPTKMKRAVGHFWVWQNIENIPYFQNSVVFTVQGHNLIFNKSEGTLTLGGSTLNDSDFAPDTGELCEQRESLLKFLPLLGDFLNPTKANLKTGLRAKGSKRQPILSEYQKDCWHLNGLYKNGYTLCHLLGKRWVKEAFLKS